jgi:paraquat-inducible protein B
MAKKANPKLIGGFVLGAIALVIIGVIAFGGGKFLATKDKAVLFFSGASLSGLDVGSPVTFRGVKIGSVTDLAIQYDVDKQTLVIPVYIEIEVNRVQIVSGRRSVQNLQALVQRGLRAQLVVQSLVTGQASIEFNFHPDTPIKLIGAEPGMIELPTIPSDIDMLKANVTDVLQTLAKLPLEQIAAEALKTVQAANKLLTELDAQVQPLSAELKSTLEQANTTMKEPQSRLELREGEPMQNLNDALIGARKLVNNIDAKVGPLASDTDKFMRAAQSTISPDSTLYFQLNQTLQGLQSAADSIRLFFNYLQRHPDALLTGKRSP